MIDEYTTERVRQPLDAVNPNVDSSDMWSTKILLKELQSERFNLKSAIEKDSYKGVKITENRIIDICTAIDKLRKR